MKKRYLPLSAVGALALMLSSAALAAPPTSNTRAAESTTVTPSAAAGGQTKGKAMLADAKLKACQAREVAITKRSTQMTKRATTLEAKFTDIVSKVDTYYTNKLVPDGKTVSNYADLKSDIAAKKAIVDTDVAKASADAASFSCAGEDAKTVMASFKTDMQQVNKDLKDYRTSIKNFTKALHQAAGDAESTASPKASESPEASE